MRYLSGACVIQPLLAGEGGETLSRPFVLGKGLSVNGHRLPVYLAPHTFPCGFEGPH